MNDKGWIDSSICADKLPQKRDKFSEDDNYLANMRERESIFKFIIQTFVFDPMEFPQFNHKYPILLMGYNSVALATELSQWKYPVTLLVRNDSEEKSAKGIMKRYNGDFTIRKGGVSGSNIIVWRDENHSWSTDKKIDFIKNLADRSQILIVATNSPALRERLIKEVKMVNVVDKYGGSPLLIIYH